MDHEKVIESVHIRAFLSQGIKQTVRNNEVSTRTKRASVKQGLTVYVKVLIFLSLRIY